MKGRSTAIAVVAVILGGAADGRAAMSAASRAPQMTPIARTEVQRLIESILGNTLIVDWHGTWDYTTIQEALSASSDGDTIIVLPSQGSPGGAYVENLVFPAKAITLRSLNPDDPAIVAATVIDGDAVGTVVTFQPGAAASAILDGFTIRAGSAEYGGGVYCSGADPSITNCVIRDNDADFDGGGIYCVDGNPTVTGCTLRENSAGATGGGMANYLLSNPTVVDCTFHWNTAEYTGGGMHNDWECKPALTDCTFSDNSADWDGGGMSNWYSDPTLIGCRFDRNRALNTGG